MDPSFGSGPLGERKNADILIDGDTIAAIGEGLHGEGAEVIDASGKIVMPGFVDIQLVASFRHHRTPAD
jgi:dihydroorotase-like cyclic amidohydrolase